MKYLERLAVQGIGLTLLIANVVFAFIYKFASFSSENQVLFMLLVVGVNAFCIVMMVTMYKKARNLYSRGRNLKSKGLIHWNEPKGH